MRGGLISYCDAGESYGLADAVIRNAFRNSGPSIDLVRIQNPLGNGTVVNLMEAAPDVIARWKTESRNQALGDPPFARLVETIEHGEIERCELTIFALGVVLLEFELSPGIAPGDIEEVLTCYEYAAYTPGISSGITSQVSQHCERAMTTWHSDFARLTTRPAPRVRSVEGKFESNLFTSFTSVITCDVSDRRGEIASLLESLEMSGRNSHLRIRFGNRSTLHYSWAAYVLEPNAEQGSTPEEELLRIAEDIKIAHACLGACEALTRMINEEIRVQIEPGVAQRDAADLNRLRTLALAVVSMTNFASVTQAEEDQKYFERFAQDATLEQTHRQIRDGAETLHSIVDADEQAARDRRGARLAEEQEARAKRESVLNIVLLALTLFTLISVASDAYNFVRDQHVATGSVAERSLVVLAFISAIIVTLAIVIWGLFGRRARGTVDREQG